MFFQGPAWKETLTFLFFLLLAFCFWLLQALQQKYRINPEKVEFSIEQQQ